MSRISRSATVFAAVCVLGAVAAYYLAIVTGPSSIRRVNGQDPKLESAIQKAKSGLGDFIAELTQPSAGQRFAVMASFSTENGNEYLWIKDPSYAPGSFTGTLDQVPVALNRRKGDTVTVKKSSIVDWMIRDPDGSIRGRFTEQAQR